MSEDHKIKHIDDLKIFEDILINNFIHILRIPGGFIYTLHFPNRVCDTTSIFISLGDSYTDTELYDLS